MYVQNGKNAAITHGTNYAMNNPEIVAGGLNLAMRNPNLLV